MSLSATLPPDRHPPGTPEPPSPGTPLEAILGEAKVRVLAPAEVDQLVSLACAAGRAADVLVELLRANTGASRQNVLAARALRGHPRARMPSRALAALPPRPPAVDLPGAPFEITQHAFQRFAQRHAETTPERALELLAQEAAQAVPIRERTLAGDQQWRSPSGVTFVVKHDGSAGGNGARGVCVTILPAEDVRDQRYLRIKSGKPGRTYR